MAVLKTLEDLADARGLSVDTLSWADISRVDGGRYGGWFSIPYPNATGTWKVRYSNPERGVRPKMLDEPGATFHLYNPGRLGPGTAEVWFAEGEFDTLTLAELGLDTIGIHGVANVGASGVGDDDEGDEDVDPRLEAWSILFEGSFVVVAFDNDVDGIRAGRRLARGLGGIVFDEWDDDYNDLNDWYSADPEGLDRAIDRFRRRHGLGEDT